MEYPVLFSSMLKGNEGEANGGRGKRGGAGLDLPSAGDILKLAQPARGTMSYRICFTTVFSVSILFLTGCGSSKHPLEVTAVTSESLQKLAERTQLCYALDHEVITLAYFDGKSLYLCDGLKLHYDELPFKTYGCLSFIETELYPAQAISLPISQVARSDGYVDLGYFEPKYRLFFRWRGSTFRADAASDSAHPKQIAVAVDPHRIVKTIDISRPKMAPPINQRTQNSVNK